MPYADKTITINAVPYTLGLKSSKDTEAIYTGEIDASKGLKLTHNFTDGNPSTNKHDRVFAQLVVEQEVTSGSETQIRPCVINLTVSCHPDADETETAYAVNAFMTHVGAQLAKMLSGQAV